MNFIDREGDMRDQSFVTEKDAIIDHDEKCQLILCKKQLIRHISLPFALINLVHKVGKLFYALN